MWPKWILRRPLNPASVAQAACSNHLYISRDNLVLYIPIYFRRGYNSYFGLYSLILVPTPMSASVRTIFILWLGLTGKHTNVAPLSKGIFYKFPRGSVWQDKQGWFRIFGLCNFQKSHTYPLAKPVSQWRVVQDFDLTECIVPMVKIPSPAVTRFLVWLPLSPSQGFTWCPPDPGLQAGNSSCKSRKFAKRSAKVRNVLCTDSYLHVLARWRHQHVKPWCTLVVHEIPHIRKELPSSTY